MLYDRFKGSNHRVIVGTSLDESTRGLIQYTHNFFARTDVELRLVHVQDSWDKPYVAVFPGEYLYSAAAWAAEEKVYEESKKKLAALTEEIAKHHLVSSNMLVGQPGEALQAEAVASKASMVVIGVKPHSHRFLPKGFSTALSLMSHSTTPVFLVPEKLKSLPTNRPIRIFVADDMTDASSSAITMMFELVCGGLFERTKIYHTHICRTSPDDMKVLARSIQELMDLGRIPFDKSFSPETFMTTTTEKFKKRLSERLGDAKNLFSKDHTEYEQKVYYGDVLDNLKKAVEECDPDVLVFGRHELLHKHPFTLGRVPFYAMLDLNKPIIMAPKSF